MAEKEDQLVGEFPFIPQQERAQQKRNALLKSGQILFSSKGYEQTTAKEIAAHAGVATGTFYRYFSDKRQLLMYLLEDKLDQFLAPEPDWISNNPERVLASLLETHGTRVRNSGIYHVLPEILAKDKELAETIQKAREKIHAKIFSKLQKIKEQGLTWQDLDLEMVTWTIMILIENGYKEEQSGIQINYRELAKIICRLVFPPEVLERLQILLEKTL
ncbi:TetR/AcrR family transcriptional regulator [Bacillus rubiinfantis]|uniref:TetR/AcrR family transcriptional regulator n=1 Tax=Bacillus rubiinfantis TaxID=1499680 RepID=UPI0005A74001|nr:TetR/AcrR family transcriptional regulator [Bacillus rubiinfantis]